MSISIDKNRINLSKFSQNRLEKARELSLLKPITSVPHQTAGEYKGVKVDTDSKENKESLVDVKDYGILSVPYYLEQAVDNPLYNEAIIGAPDVNYAREGVCEKIKKANEMLDEIDLAIVVVDAHRSPTTQGALFNAFLNKAHEMGYVGEEAQNFALDYCSSSEGFDEKNSRTWTIHSTGGAVDVYLLDKQSGKIVDMGEGCFDNPDDVTHTRYYEQKKEEGKITPEEEGFAGARRILFNTMNEAGFVNYGHECFHYSYNDLYYALVKGESAKYGYKKSPKQVELEKVLYSVMGNKFEK